MSEFDERPTDDEVRSAYQLGRSGCGCCAYMDDDDRDLFDGWLMARDERVKAEALREAADALAPGNGAELAKGATSRSQVSANARRWLRDRADALSASAGDADGRKPAADQPQGRSVQ